MKKGFSEILLVLLVGVVILAGVGYWYFSMQSTEQKRIQNTNVTEPTLTPNIAEPSIMPSPRSNLKEYNKYTKFPNEDFDFISMDIPDGWSVETKYFGETNDLDFPSFYRPECSTKTCAGIRLTKDNARLEMVFDQGYDSAGYLCTDNEDYYDNLNNNWVRLNYPTDSSEDYLHRYVYSKDYSSANRNFDPGEQANGDWYYPSLTNWKSTNQYALCITGSPLFRSERIYSDFEKLKADGGQFEIPAIVASSPRLYSINSNSINQSILSEVDTIISSIDYTD